MDARLNTLFLVVILIALPASSGAQDCLEPAGRFPYGATQAVVAQGNLAYMGNGAALMVVDLLAPASPAIVGTLALADEIMSLAIDGDRLYAGTRAGLNVIDVSTPTAPMVVGALERYWLPFDMAASGNILCVHEQGLLVFDVSDPSAPVEASTWPLYQTSDVEMVGHHAFITYGGLEVLDLTDPSAPVNVGSLSGIQGRLDAEGNFLYAADDDHFRVIVISDPTVPVLMGSTGLTGTVKDVAAHGDLAFVSTAISGLRVIDIGDPSAPLVTGTAPMPAGSLNESWVSVAAIADHGLVATWDHGLRVIAAADPANPSEVSVVDSVAVGEGASYSGGIVFTAAGDRGLRVVDVSDPSAPEDLTIFDLGGQVADVDVVGDVAYAASPRFTIIDASDPSQPVVIGENPAIWGEGIKVIDDLAYIATWFGLQVVDVSAPTMPVEFGSINLGNENWHSVDVLGTIAAVRSGSTIAIVDVSDPSSPFLRSSLNPVWSLTGPVRYGASLIFASGSSLYTFDLTDPDNPIEVPEVLEPRDGIGVAVSGSVAYLGTTSLPPGPSGIEAWDIGDPTNPTLMGARSDVGSVQHFAFSDEHVFPIRKTTGFDAFALCQGPLFADGFESGDTTAWSSAVP